MGLWPFGGGGGGKKHDTAGLDPPRGQEVFMREKPAERMVRNMKGGLDAHPPVGSNPNLQDDGAARRLSKLRTSTSNAPARSQTAPVSSRGGPSKGGSRATSRNEKSIYGQDPRSQSSLGPDQYAVPTLPTLFAKRSDTDSQLSRQKSSRRKAEDQAREQEIRAMSSMPIPIPTRPSTLHDSSSARRGSKQISSGTGRKSERPMSEVSLPIASSYPDVEILSNQNSFKVGILAALSPRPTIKYDASSRLGSSRQAQRANLAIQKAIEEEDVSDTKRIDELADDLDAGGLRELMERDRRRREQKKEADLLKLQRKLHRRAERQREDEARKARVEAFVRESPMLSGQASISSGPRRPKAPIPNPFADNAEGTRDGAYTPVRNPFEDEIDFDVTRGRADPDDDELNIPIPLRSPLRQLSNPPTKRLSQSTISPPQSPVHMAADQSSVSQFSASVADRDNVYDLETAAPPPIPERRVSGRHAPRVASWTTFFKRGTRRGYTKPSHGRATTPSEFSNASRESVPHRQPSLTDPNRSFRRSGSGTAQRTASRFREDLPEHPTSPSDPPLQFPEVSMALPSAAATADLEPMSATLTGPMTDYLAAEPSTPTEANVRQTLATVDSEGSWLSGKPSKRFSGPGSLSEGLRRSHSSLQRATSDSLTKPGGELPDLPDTAMTSALTETAEEPEPVGAFTAPIEEIADDDSDRTSSPGDETWHIGVGQQATVIKQPGRAVSREGLLSDYLAEKAAPSAPISHQEGEVLTPPDVESPGTRDVVDAPLLRATSVDYKGHIRAVSAGSAKLLEIKRSSTHSDTSRPRSPTLARKSALGLEEESATAAEPDSDRVTGA